MAEPHPPTLQVPDTPWVALVGRPGDRAGAPVTKASYAQDSGAFAAGRGLKVKPVWGTGQPCLIPQVGLRSPCMMLISKGMGSVSSGGEQGWPSPPQGQAGPTQGLEGEGGPGSVLLEGSAAQPEELEPGGLLTGALPGAIVHPFLSTSHATAGLTRGRAAGLPHGPREAGHPTLTLGSATAPADTGAGRGFPAGPHAPGPPPRPWPSPTGTDPTHQTS